MQTCQRRANYGLCGEQEDEEKKPCVVLSARIHPTPLLLRRFLLTFGANVMQTCQLKANSGLCGEQEDEEKKACVVLSAPLAPHSLV